MTARGDFAPILADPVSTPDAPLPAPAHADIRPTEPATIPRPDPVPTQLAQRIAAVPMMTDRDAPLELTLDPPELGAIRVSVSRGAEGMVLHLQADLPETLDLLRRNGAALMQELQRQGLDHAGFSFSGRDPGGQQHRPDAPPPGVREDDAHINPSHISDRSPVTSARTGQSGLDIRL
ncbi:flagellar hook-length control protein FliK [Nioella sp.]|uniref:flagellar hook-length control protein FliK n=1 Tax=Nioella sp. TaxID=1912091 RepID=UPI003B524A7B